ncbi:MAG: DNA translocase FtsK [Candidatus Neomarinimicrobiota bacterium]
MKERKLEILGILSIAISFLVVVSMLGYNSFEDPGISPNVLVENPMGILGVFIAYFFIKFSFGYSSFFLPILGMIWGWWFFSNKDRSSLKRISAYLLCAMILISISLGLLEINTFSNSEIDFNYSGLIGGNIANLLASFFGIIGTIVILLTSWLILIRGYFSWSFYVPFESVINLIKKKSEDRKITSIEKKTEKEKRLHTKDLIKKIEEKQKEENYHSVSNNKHEGKNTDDEKIDDLKNENRSNDENKVVEDVDGGTVEDVDGGTVVEDVDGGTVVEDVDGGTVVEDVDGGTVVEDVDNSLSENASNQKLESEFDKIEEQGQTSEISSDKNIEVGEVVKEEEVNIDELQERKAPKRKYQLPSSDLLEMPIKIQEGMSKDELVDRANFLTQSLETFGVVGKVVNVSPGPVITLFEVEPAEGVRVNKFVQLSDDLARVMEASRVRVIAPIPGKSSVGIEIPNKDPDTVFFRSIINSEKFAESDAELTLAIGKTTSGEISTLNLAKMPHLLIAGTTGSGKSVCLNTIICSLLYNSTPEELKFVIVDPKKVEMTLYKSLKGYHLLGMEDFEESIVTKPDNATLALRAVEKEMSRRYDTLADAVVRNIQEYNAKKVASSEEIMPYIVVVVDELADLMMLNAKEVEQPIARLAQLARAVGIHLVIATQRPSVDVITGLIKANFPSRIAFQVASKIDSRTILDMPGAEKLIGRGDMLYLGSGSSEPVRLHNAFLSINEVEAIMDHILSQPKSEELVLESVREQTTIDADSGDNAEGDDELLNEAIKLVIIHQQGSISLIQRRMKVGYSRAARLIDRMEQLGVVGSFTGSKAREVMVDETYLEMINDD